MTFCDNKLYYSQRMDQRYAANVNNPVKEEMEPDNDEDEGGAAAIDSFKSDSDFQEESDPDEMSRESQTRRNKQSSYNHQGPNLLIVEDVDENDVAARLRPRNQEEIILLQ